MPRTPKGVTLTPFYSALGELIVIWNQAENRLRAILVGLCGIGPRTWILTAELGAISLENALRSSSQDIALPDLKPHIEACIKWFNLLREYRNYYVHGIIDVNISFGYISQTSAKNGLVLHGEVIDVTALSDLIKKIKDFLDFSSDVEFRASALPLTSFSDGKPFPPLPKIPLLPDRLQKPRRYLTDVPPQPSPSRKK